MADFEVTKPKKLTDELMMRYFVELEKKFQSHPINTIPFGKEVSYIDGLNDILKKPDKYNLYKKIVS